MKNYRFSVVIEMDEEGYYVFCPELQGLKGALQSPKAIDSQ